MGEAGHGAEREFQRARRAHWDAVALARAGRAGASGAYRRRLQAIYRHLIPEGSRVLEVGCSEGDLLASLRPAAGVGVDLSPEMISAARRCHPELEFVELDAHDLGTLGQSFDYIVLSDLLHDVWDIQRVLTECRRVCAPRAKVILNVHSRLWAPVLGLVRHLGLARPNLEQSWVTVADTRNLIHLAGLRCIRSWTEVLLPLPVPLVAPLANRLLVKVWPVSHLALANFLVARAAGEPPPQAPRVSVVVPARNEAGNIAAILDRTPEMGAGTEIVFVEGGSTDGTFETIQREITAHPGRRVFLHRQAGKGKGDAVRLGFARSSGDVLLILDADLTVPPESLPRFVDALWSEHAEFVNGVRLVYPMEQRAMRFPNLVANKLFSWAFTFLLGQPIKDTLCGTKALRRETYKVIAANRGHFGDVDPFGDFDLLFGAARLNLEIVEMPVRYGERTYGATNIRRWSHGLLLLRMCLRAATRVKFV